MSHDPHEESVARELARDRLVTHGLARARLSDATLENAREISPGVVYGVCTHSGPWLYLDGGMRECRNCGTVWAVEDVPGPTPIMKTVRGT